MLRRLMIAGNTSGAGGLVSDIRFEGEDGSTAIVDSAGLVWSIGAGVRISTAQKAEGISSGFFSGATPSTMYRSSAQFDFSKDFTVQVYVRRTSADECVVFCVDGSASVHVGNHISIGVDGRVMFAAQRAGVWSDYSSFKSVASIPVDTWALIRVVKKGLSVSMFLNGAPDASMVLPGNIIPPAGRLAIIGSYYLNPYRGMKGYLDSFRFRQSAVYP